MESLWFLAFLWLVSLLLTVFYVYEFVQLMLMKQEDFAGRNDRLVWGLFFLFGGIIAAVAFWHWNLRRGSRSCSYQAIHRLKQEDQPNVDFTHWGHSQEQQ